MSTATFHTTGPTSADLTARVDAAIAAVGNACGEGSFQRAEAIRLAHRWVAQQDRHDVVRLTRQLDAWTTQLNRACRSTRSARPVVRIGLRLRTAGF